MQMAKKRFFAVSSCRFLFHLFGPNCWSTMQSITKTGMWLLLTYTMNRQKKKCWLFIMNRISISPISLTWSFLWSNQNWTVLWVMLLLLFALLTKPLDYRSASQLSNLFLIILMVILLYRSSLSSLFLH